MSAPMTKLSFSLTSTMESVDAVEATNQKLAVEAASTKERFRVSRAIFPVSPTANDLSCRRKAIIENRRARVRCLAVKTYTVYGRRRTLSGFGVPHRVHMVLAR
jgi:hypothetical protein